MADYRRDDNRTKWLRDYAKSLATVTSWDTTHVS